MLPYYYNISSFTSSYYFQLPPPPLSSFDLLFWLGGGPGCKKFVSTRALLGANKKKFLIPGGEYNRYL